MSTTTIRIEEDLKARIAAAAHLAGKTSHAFILDAIAQTVEQVEIDEEFHRLADERWAKVPVMRPIMKPDCAAARGAGNQSNASGAAGVTRTSLGA